MKRTARITDQLLAHLRLLMGGVIVSDGMDLLAGWNACLDGVEEADEVLATMPLHAAPDDPSIQHVECDEQRGGAAHDLDGAAAVRRQRHNLSSPDLLPRAVPVGNDRVQPTMICCIRFKSDTRAHPADSYSGAHRGIRNGLIGQTSSTRNRAILPVL